MAGEPEKTDTRTAEVRPTARVRTLPTPASSILGSILTQSQTKQTTPHRYRPASWQEAEQSGGSKRALCEGQISEPSCRFRPGKSPSNHKDAESATRTTYRNAALLSPYLPTTHTNSVNNIKTLTATERPVSCALSAGPSIRFLFDIVRPLPPKTFINNNPFI